MKLHRYSEGIPYIRLFNTLDLPELSNFFFLGQKLKVARLAKSMI